MPGLPESYRLVVGPDNIRISAPDARGLFYGAVTLWQLATPDGATGEVRIPVKIEDAPRFAWRGYMLDSARHFESVAEIESLLDAMALHKLNVFHWHLSDDQGWRVEIRAYPELAHTGGCRASAENPAAPPECGWYTQAQIRHIVDYAARRNITVVPEIDMPGHATAAIAAYPRLGVSGQRIRVERARHPCQPVQRRRIDVRLPRHGDGRNRRPVPEPLHPRRRRRGHQGPVERLAPHPGTHARTGHQGCRRAPVLFHRPHGRFAGPPRQAPDRLG
jgi:N-acetyl-beta-hexosaminidase